ncbi:IS66 family transposase [Ligilactobacillus ruminis]|uniref:IS66 family transposase n=1 Tax=Ligilactobacillus ruminis TaxID=1623 RepID=UPI003B9DA3E6
MPAKLRLLEHHQAVYKCPECSSDDHSKISKAPISRSLISHSKTGSPSIVAHIAAMKYVYKVPCYRQEAMWKLKGLPLTRQQMSKWLIDVFNNQLSPLYDLLLKELKRQRFLHVEETPYNKCWLQKKPTLIIGLSQAENLKKNIVAFTHSDGKSSETAKKLLSDFNGYGQTDGYAGYNFLDRTRHLGCLAHVRRYILSIL